VLDFSEWKEFACDFDEETTMTMGRERGLEVRKGREGEVKKSNVHNSCRTHPDFDVNYSIRGRLSL
jgi:hypothetical protein